LNITRRALIRNCFRSFWWLRLRSAACWLRESGRKESDQHPPATFRQGCQSYWNVCTGSVCPCPTCRPSAAADRTCKIGMGAADGRGQIHPLCQTCGNVRAEGAQPVALGVGGHLTGAVQAQNSAVCDEKIYTFGAISMNHLSTEPRARRSRDQCLSGLLQHRGPRCGPPETVSAGTAVRAGWDVEERDAMGNRRPA